VEILGLLEVGDAVRPKPYSKTDLFPHGRTLPKEADFECHCRR